MDIEKKVRSVHCALTFLYMIHKFQQTTNFPSQSTLVLLNYYAIRTPPNSRCLQSEVQIVSEDHPDNIMDMVTLGS